MGCGASCRVDIGQSFSERVGPRNGVRGAGISGQRDWRKSKLRDKNFDYVDNSGVGTPVCDSVFGDQVNVDFDMVDPVIEWWCSDH